LKLNRLLTISDGKAMIAQRVNLLVVGSSPLESRLIVS